MVQAVLNLWPAHCGHTSSHCRASFGKLTHLTQQNGRDHEERDHHGGDDIVPRVLTRRKNLCYVPLGKLWEVLSPCCVLSLASQRPLKGPVRPAMARATAPQR